MNDITHTLECVEQGDGKAAVELLPLVSEELRKLAMVRMAQQHPAIHSNQQRVPLEELELATKADS